MTEPCNQLQLNSKSLNNDSEEKSMRKKKRQSLYANSNSSSDLFDSDHLLIPSSNYSSKEAYDIDENLPSTHKFNRIILSVKEAALFSE